MGEIDIDWTFGDASLSFLHATSFVDVNEDPTKVLSVRNALWP
jgi:hypothetical protein